MRNYTKSILFLFLVIGVFPLKAESISESWNEYEEVIKKRFEFNTSEPSIFLENSYGDLIITSSNVQEANLEIIITVEAKSKSRAEEIFEHITIDFDDDPSKLKVKTRYIGKSGGWTKKNEKFNIDYKVTLPEDAFLSLKNKYGDISLSDHNNDVEVNLKYGSGSLQGVSGDLELNLSYADKFYVGEVEGDLETTLAYSDLSVEKGKNVESVSKYSDVSFDEIDDIECDSKYDNYMINNVRKADLDDKYSNYSIGFVDEIFIDMAYSEIRIKKMSKQGIFDTSYGSVNIRKVENIAESIDIESGHTEYRIGYDGGLGLDIETEYTSVEYPEDVVISYKDKDDNELNLKGSKKGQGNLKVTATMKYGELKIVN